MKMCPIAYKLCKSAQNQINFKYIAKDLNYLQKWWIFAKSGHTAPATKFERQEAEWRQPEGHSV